MFSNTAEYALRAALHLATHPDKPCAVHEIAAATKVPAGYLSKVLQDLARAGIVQAQRGPNGGYTLAQRASAVTVLGVVNAVDPIKRIRTCPLGLPEHGTKLCRLHRRLDNAIAAVERELATSSIAEMVECTDHSRCTFPIAPSVNGAALPQEKRSKRRAAP